MAYGFGKSLLMLAHAPYENPPLDYRDLLRVHSTAAQCTDIFEEWLAGIQATYAAQQRDFRTRQKEVQAQIALQAISLGEHIAENEQHLLEYFIETAAYNEALRTSQSLICVGRKGSGKTANLYMIADRLREDSSNHVCIIKPQDYELEGVVRLFGASAPRAELGYLRESLWKFLVYTELALSVYNELASKPKHYVPTTEERDFLAYVDERGDLIKSEFTVRLESAVEKLCQVDVSESATMQRAKISEILHSRLLAELREHLGTVLGKRRNVCVIVDNLDKAWRQRSDIVILSDFIFGLLSVSRSISVEFQKAGATWRPVNLRIIVFVRSDIFSYVLSEAREGDKLPYLRMDWDEDDGLLQRIIEERFAWSLGEETDPEDVWPQFFEDRVNGTATKEYLVSRIIPRPRDIVFLCKAALANANNHRHGKIHATDILQAEKEYSRYAINSLLAEADVQFSNFEELLYAFAGAEEIISKQQLDSFMDDAKLPPEMWPEALSLLVDSTFLGLEIGAGRFQFVYDKNKSKLLYTLAKKVSESTGQERFRINAAFQSFLEIRPVADTG